MDCEPSDRSLCIARIFITISESLDFGVCRELGKQMRDSETCARLMYFSNRSSAVISIGAATLADIFDPAVRGRKVSVNLCQHADPVPMTHIVFEDGNLLHSTTARTGNFDLV